MPSPIDHAALARDAWQATLGAPPEQRIARWTELLASDPQTPYRNAIELEIASLKQQIAERDAALAKARTSTDDRATRHRRARGRSSPRRAAGR